MIEGSVNAAREAVITLAVQGPSGETREIEATIDTGFGGFLTLPPPVIADMGLPYRGMGFAVLADGSEITFPHYRLAVVWDGRLTYGLAEAANIEPLAGTALLDDYRLCMDVQDGGRVVIEPVPSPPPRA